MADQVALAFIVPVPHPARVPNWDAAIARLEQTVGSIAAQSDGSWSATIVANRQAALPELIDRCRVVRVDLPVPDGPPVASGRDLYNGEDRHRRVAAGAEHTRDARFLMVVEPGDLLSCDLVAFAHARPEAPGWTITRGCLWSEGSRVVMETGAFADLCETSQIVRADLCGSAADSLWDDSTVFSGSDSVAAQLAAQGVSLPPLPFTGALQRLPSGRTLLWDELPAKVLRDPRRAVSNLLGLRILTASRMARFGMESLGGSDVPAGMHPATRTVDLG